MRAYRSAAGSSGDATTVHGYIRTSGDTGARGFIYNDDDTLLAQAAARSDIGSAAWYDSAITASISSGNNYKVGWHGFGTELAYDSGSGDGWFYLSLDYPNNPDPITWGSQDTNRWSAYVTYTEASTGQPIAKRMGGVPFMARNRGVW